MNYISNITRAKGDPKVLHAGPSSLGVPDRLGRALGWFSIGLGVSQLLMAEQFTDALGMEGNEGLVRIYGIREIGSGIVSLSLDKEIGLWSRVGGDALDTLTLITALRPGNQKRDNVWLALASVAGLTLLDVLSAQAVAARHRRKGETTRDYRSRSGFSETIEKARGAARDAKPSREPRAVPVRA